MFKPRGPVGFETVRGTPDSVFRRSLHSLPIPVQHNRQIIKGTNGEWDIQWAYAVPPRRVNEAVNKEGYHKNLVVYHGTGKSFDHFSDDDPPRNPHTPDREIKGHFFTTDPASAHTYAHRSAKASGGKPRIVAATLHMDNPYNATKEIKKHMKAGMSFSDAKNTAYRNVDRRKHDGVYHDGNGANHSEYVAFHAHQIRPR